jgi:hypothetical protein
VTRVKLRSPRQTAERCAQLGQEVRTALQHEGPADPLVVDAIWRAEALGTLLWALQLVELPSYDRAFDTRHVLELDAATGHFREHDDIALELEAARLWHWRARTTLLQASGQVSLPERFSTVEQLVGATAMRGFEEGLLPTPMRGDFPAFGKVYRQLSPEQRSEAHSIAYERHLALAWLCSAGDWDGLLLDT